MPSAPPRTQRQALTDLADLAGAPAPTVRGTSPALLKVLGVAVPAVREIAGVAYQFAAPFVLDDSDARRHFGLEATPWAVTLRAVLAAGRGQAPVAPAGRAA